MRECESGCQKLVPGPASNQRSAPRRAQAERKKTAVAVVIAVLLGLAAPARNGKRNFAQILCRQP